MTFTPFQRQRIAWLLAHSEELGLGVHAKQRLKWFSFAAEHRGNVSVTCRHFGIARSTYLRWLKRFDPRDERTLEELSRSPKHVRQSTVSKDAIARIAALRREQHHLSKKAISVLLAQSGIALSTATIGRIITRYGLFFGHTASHKEKRGMTANIASNDASDQGAPPFFLSLA